MNKQMQLALTASTAMARVYAPGEPLNAPSEQMRNRMMTTPPAALGDVLALVPGASVDADKLLKRSPDSAAMLEYWDQTDTIVDGAKAMRLAGDKYLPKFNDEGSAEYDFRLQMTKFTNVYRDIVEGLSTKPFEEEVTLISSDEKTVPEAIEKFIEDVDGGGSNLTVFASLTFFNGINSAIDWIFVDYPTVDATVIRSVADLKAAKLRPFWSHVLGRNVLEARVDMVNGKETLTYIRILEPGKPDHVRIFERNAATGQITWQLWVKSDTAVEAKTQFVIEAQGVITIDEIPLVPFITGRRDGRSFKLFPAMQDAADLQIELYQQESGLKFIKTMSAYPMLAANGIRPQMEPDGKTPKKLAVKPMAVLYGIPDSQGNAGSWNFIQPDSGIMTFLAADVKATIEQLRELGRQPLTAQSGNLTVITTAVAAGKAKSAVGAWALQLKDALENALVITCKWENISTDSYDPEVNVFNEFDNFTDDGKDVEALNAMRTGGDLSQETLHSEMKRRKVLAPEFDHDKEVERLLKEVPADADEFDDDGNPIPKPVNQPAKQPGKVAKPKTQTN